MPKNNEDGCLDRMGKFIGETRSYAGIPLNRLSNGICTTVYLNQIENGLREAGKLLTDALLQRLGKPVELFEQILDRKEFRQWQRRQQIVAYLNQGEIEKARNVIKAYAKEAKGALDAQFLQIEEINCLACAGAAAEELLPLVQQALACTRSDFSQKSLDNMLLSHMEGYLLLAWLELREQTEGLDIVGQDYLALYRCLKQPRYDRRERVYLSPFVACHVIKWAQCRGQLSTALTICLETLEELTAEKRLLAYDRLLAWKQRLLTEMGAPDDETASLLEHLKGIQSTVSPRKALLIPYEERGHVFCLNQILRDRRKLLGMSQEELAEGICDPRTVSRIETQSTSPQKEVRKRLLQKVNMSGERYDYQIITESYKDYILCSDYGRAWNGGDLKKAAALLSKLHKRVPDTKTNRQYLMAEDAYMRGKLPEPDAAHLSPPEVIAMLEKAMSITLPLDLKDLDNWPVCILSVNEIYLFLSCAAKYKKQGQYEKSLSLLSYVKRCLENNGADVVLYENIYTWMMLITASIQGDLGHYREANALDLLCIQLSLESQNSYRLAINFYDMAWNTEQLLTGLPERERQAKQEDALSLFRQAYAASIIAGDTARQHHIKEHCQNRYGLDITSYDNPRHTHPSKDKSPD